MKSIRDEAVIRQERGWAGHFICADQCLFRRNTLLTCGDVRIVVSTVGLWKANYVTDGTMDFDRKFQELGPGRYFETRAFHAKYIHPYWDANISREVFFESPWCVTTPDADDIANEQHDAVVEEIAGWMEAASRQVFIEEVCNAKNE